MSAKLKVLVSSNDFPPSATKILSDNFTVLQSKYLNFDEEGRTLNKEELLRLIPGCSGLVWCFNLPITKDLLDAAGPSLKVVATASAGYNHCALDELKSRGIQLSNTPEVLSSAVAEIAVSLMLATSRRFTENLAQVQSGKWEIGFSKVLGQDIRGSTVGVIGLGGIGQAVVRRLAGFELGRVVYTGHREKPEAKALNAEFVPLDTLLSSSDFVLLACPLTKETRHIVNKTNLAKMKKNAVVINIGRGDLIDQESLYDALKNNDIYAAGLDVTTPEPLPKDHKLLTLPNVFVLPHVGSATARTRRDMGELAARNVVRALHGEPLVTPVIL